MIFINKKIARVDFFNKKVRINNKMLNNLSSIKQDKKNIKSIEKEYLNFIKFYSNRNYQPYYLEMEIKKSYLD